MADGFEVWKWNSDTSSYERVDLDSSNRKIVSVGRVERKVWEVPIARITEINDVLGDNDEIKIVYRGETVFGGFVQDKSGRANENIITHGYMLLPVSKFVVVSEENKSPEEVIEDVFSMVWDGFRVHFTQSSGETLNRFQMSDSAWNVIKKILDTLGWVIKFGDERTYDSDGWKVDVWVGDIYSVGDTYTLRSSYYKKKYGADDYEINVLDLNKEISRVINELYIAPRGRKRKNEEEFTSWTDLGDEIEVQITYAYSDDLTAYYSTDSGSTWTEYADEEITVLDDKITVVLAKKTDMTNVKVIYTYEYLTWVKLTNTESINMYGRKSKKEIIRWTADIDKAISVGQSLLSYLSVPHVKGKFAWAKKTFTEFELFDVLDIYHDMEEVYRVYVRAVHYPNYVVEFSTIDMKMREWNVDLDRRVRELERIEAGKVEERTFINLYRKNIQIEMQENMVIIRAKGFVIDESSIDVNYINDGTAKNRIWMKKELDDSKRLIDLRNMEEVDVEYTYIDDNITYGVYVNGNDYIVQMTWSDGEYRRYTYNNNVLTVYDGTNTNTYSLSNGNIFITHNTLYDSDMNVLESYSNTNNMSVKLISYNDLKYLDIWEVGDMEVGYKIWENNYFSENALVDKSWGCDVWQ